MLTPHLSPALAPAPPPGEVECASFTITERNGELLASPRNGGTNGNTAPRYQALSLKDITLNIFNVYVGAGLLQLPFAFRLAGWVGFPIIFVLTAFMAWTGRQLMDCVYAVAKDSSVAKPAGGYEYSSVGRLAFGVVGERIYGTCVVFELGLYSSYFLILTATTINGVLGPYAVSMELLVMIMGIIGVGLMFAPIAILSLINRSFGLSSLLLCFFALVVGGLMLPTPVESSNRPIITNLSGFMSCFGLVSVCYAGHPCLPVLFAQCEDKAKFKIAQTAGVALAGAFYTVVGAVGFYLYGTYTEGVFTWNVGRDLDGVPLSNLEWLQPMISAGIIIKTMVVFPFVAEPVCIPVDKSVSWYLGGGSKALVRVLVVLLVTIIAVVFSEHIVELADVTGCMATMTTNILLPGLAHLAIFRNEPGLRASRAFTLFAILCGILTGTFGTLNAISNMTSDSDEAHARVLMSLTAG